MPDSSCPESVLNLSWTTQAYGCLRMIQLGVPRDPPVVCSLGQLRIKSIKSTK